MLDPLFQFQMQLLKRLSKLINMFGASLSDKDRNAMMSYEPDVTGEGEIYWEGLVQKDKAAET